MIDAMISSLSEEIKNERKKLLDQRHELAKQRLIESKAPDLVQLPSNPSPVFLLQLERSLTVNGRGRNRRAGGRVGMYLVILFLHIVTN